MREYYSLEIIRGSHHVDFRIDDASRVGEARRYAMRVSNSLGFDDELTGRVALIVTELGTNLFKHAYEGRLLIASRTGADHEIEILSIDNGPGIANVDIAMRDGFSTGGSPGTGLGAAQRLADDFDIFSNLASGTIIVARVRNQSSQSVRQQHFRLGVVALCAPGEEVCGDGWVVALDGEKAAILMADGLGHGPDAMAAAEAAARLFLDKPFEKLTLALENSHAALRMTRGAAVAMAIIDAELSTIQSAGAGNIITRLVSGTTNRTLLSQHGTVGVQLRRIEEITYTLPPYALIIMHTDGLISRWGSEVLAGVISRDPSIAAAILLRDFCRGRDDVTVLVLHRRYER